MSELLGAVGGGAVGLAVGEAGATVLEPALEAPKQEAWKNSKARILELHDLATLVATTLSTVGDVQDRVDRNGYEDSDFASAVQLALKVPGIPDAEKLYLRGLQGYPGAINLAQLHHAYGKAALEGQWWDQLTLAAQNVLLTPAQIALGIIRSLITDPGFIPGGPYDLSGRVPAYPASGVDAVAMAKAAGITEDLLRVMVGSIGLPPSVQQLASMQFRNIIDPGDYNRGIAEGDARPEWGPYWLEQARVILSPHEWVDARLRGWVTTDAEMYAGTALHGMTQANTDLLFELTGRPLAIHQITTGLARGGTFGGEYEGVPEPYLSAVRESNIRPEYGNIDYANRFTYPSGFEIKADATAGNLTEAETEEILLELGWDPKWAAHFAASWTSATTGANKHVTSSSTALVTAARKAYVGGAANQAQAAAALTTAQVDPGIQAQLFTLWDAQKTLEALSPV